MNKKISINEVLFLSVFGFWFLITNFRITQWNGIFNFDGLTSVSKYMLYALTLYMFVAEKKKSSFRMIASILFVAFSYLVASRCGFNMIFIISLFMVSAYEVDYKKIFKLSIVIMIIVMIITVAAVGMGIIENKNWGTPGRDRISLGYNYCTYIAYVIMFISFMYMTVRENITKFEGIIICMLQVVVFAITRTNATLIITVGIIFTYLFLNCFFRKIPRFVAVLGTLFPTVACAISYFGHALYDVNNPIWFKINTLLSTRLELGYKAVQDYRITLLGQKIKWVGWGTMAKHPNWGPERYNNVDSFFLRALLTYGIIYTLIIVIGFSIVIYYAYKQNNKGMFWAAIGMVSFGIVDTEMIDLRFQPFVLLIVCVIAIKNKEGLENADVTNKKDFLSY